MTKAPGAVDLRAADRIAPRAEFAKDLRRSGRLCFRKKGWVWTQCFWREKSEVQDLSYEVRPRVLWSQQVIPGLSLRENSTIEKEPGPTDRSAERSHFHVATILRAAGQKVDTSPNEATFTSQRFCGRAHERAASRRTNPLSRGNDFAGERTNKPSLTERSHFHVATILRAAKGNLPSPRTNPLSRHDDFADSGRVDTIDPTA